MLGRTVTAGALAALILAAGSHGLPASEGTATWLAPEALGAGFDPVVAMNASGDAVVAWTDRVAVRAVVRASYRPAGGTWQRYGEWYVGWSTKPSAAIDGAGTAVVVWTRQAGPSISVVEAVVRPPGRDWQDPTVVSAPEGWARDSSARVGVDSAGNATVVWVALYREPMGILSVYRPVATGRWGAPVAVAPGYEVELATSSSGKALIAWETFDQLGYGVAAAVGQAGRWSALAVIARQQNTRLPGVSGIVPAINSRGDGLVAWDHTEHGNSIVQASSFRAGSSGWEPARDLSFADGQAWSPAVALDAQGNALAVWNTNVDVEGSSRRAGGGRWEEPAVVSSSHNAGKPALAVNGRGDAVAVWTGSGLEATSRPGSTGVWEPTTQIAPAGAAPGSGLAIDEAGNALAASGRWDGNRSSIEVVALDASGPVLSRLRAARHGDAGQPLTFGVQVRDTWSRSGGPPSWTFGDGGSASGLSVRHVYRAPGQYAVTVRAVDQLGHASQAAVGITIVPARIARATARPRIRGMPLVGRRLVCTSGMWSGSPPIRYRYRWLRNGSSIAGATARAYRVRARDAGALVACRVEARNAGGIAWARSRAVRVHA